MFVSRRFTSVWQPALLGLALLLSLLLSATGRAAPGDLDPTFGLNGTVVTPLLGYDEATTVLVQPDGKIVAGGFTTDLRRLFALTRYLPDGSLDSSFGGGGILWTGLDNNNDTTGRELLQQPDDKLVLVGGGGDFHVVRYLPDGSLDPTFSGDGQASATFTGWSSAFAGALSGDSIIAAGASDIGAPGGEQAVLARFTTAGALDNSFGSGGQVVLDLDFPARISAVAVAPDGKIILAGQRSNGSDFDLLVARLLPDGAFDTSFAGNGYVVIDVNGGDDMLQSVALRLDGKIVAGGEAHNGGDRDFAAVRLHGDGSLDTSFAGNGVVTTDVAGGDDRSFGLQLLPTGLALTGGAETGTDIDVILAAYLDDGTLDMSFGTGGLVTIAASSGDDWGRAVTAQSDGRLVVAGGRDSGGSGADFVLFRLETGANPLGELILSHDSPTELGKPTKLVAATTGGTPNDYQWSFGDGATATDGGFQLHTYPATGSYTATVTVANGFQTLTATAAMQIIERGTIAGYIWQSETSRFEFVPGDSYLKGVGVTVHHLDAGVDVGSYLSDANGFWEASGLLPGRYRVTVMPPAGFQAWEAAVQVILPDGGMLPASFALFAALAPDTASLRGVAWIDSNGDNRPEPGETLLAGVPVTVTLPSGRHSAQTDGNGRYQIDLPLQGADFITGTVAAAAPSALGPDYPPRQGFFYAEPSLYNFNFRPLGTIMGQVSGPPEAIAGLTLTLNGGGGGVTTETDNLGYYSFTGVVAGVYELILTPPAGLHILGFDRRDVFLGAGSQIENWLLVASGALALQTQGSDFFHPAPVGGVPIQISNSLGFSETHTTDVYGRATVAGLAPRLYTVRPDMASLPAGTTVQPVVIEGLSVSSSGSSQAQFALSESRVIRIGCVADDGIRFDCNVIIKDLASSTILLDQGLSREMPIIDYLVPGDGNYQVIITVIDDRFPNMPPSYRVLAISPAHPQQQVSYPRLLNQGVRTIRGHVAFDENGDGQISDDEFDNDIANGITVSIGSATVTTGPGPSGEAGYFEHIMTGAGSRRVSFELPDPLGGFDFVPVTGMVQVVLVNLVAPAQPVLFGFQAGCETCISGRVFYDDGDGAFGAGDLPAPDQEIRLLTPIGTTITTTTTADGRYQFAGLLPLSSYLVTLDWPAGLPAPTYLTRGAITGFPNHAIIDYALPRSELTPRLLTFLDQNGNSAREAYETLVNGIELDLYDNIYCAGPATERQRSGPPQNHGTATFSTLLLAPGCVKAVALPPHLITPDFPGQTVVPARSGATIFYPLAPNVGSLNVLPYQDHDGDQVRDDDEPILDAVDVTINGVTYSTGVGGLLVNLAPGAYTITIDPPAGMSTPSTIPVANVTTGSQHRIEVPYRFAGSISGRLTAPSSSHTFASVTVELRRPGGALVATTQTAGGPHHVGSFVFSDVATGRYYLTIPAVEIPPGFALAEEPLFLYRSGISLSRNLSLHPDAIAGFVYWDNNFNGQRGSSEPPANNFEVYLLDDQGNQRLTTTAVDGSYSFTDLQPGRLYQVTTNDPLGPLHFAITQSPGWFTLGATLPEFSIGVGPFDAFNPTTSVISGEIYERVDGVRRPIPGVVIGVYTCSDTAPILLTQATTSINGRYTFQVNINQATVSFYGRIACIEVLSAPGYNSEGTWPVHVARRKVTPFGVLYQPIINLDQDLRLSAATRQGLVNVTWQAFRDDNLNGVWDHGEAPLADVGLSAGAISALSRADGYGELNGVAQGQYQLAITPPAGFTTVGPATIPFYFNGVETTLPPIGLRPAGLLAGVAFLDFDGDGWLADDGYERGIGEVQIALSGPATVAVTTPLSGRFNFLDLPPGSYTATVTVPAGFQPISQQTVVVGTDGAVLNLPLRFSDHVSGVIYEDWDGDGRRGADEPSIATPVTTTLGTLAPQLTAMGHVLFWNVPAGSHHLDSDWPALTPQMVAAGVGSAWPVVLPGTVQGTLWVDADRDGLRQPWEAPLAGVALMLNGETASTDDAGRFSFFPMVTGTHNLTVTLPEGLELITTPVVVTADRGVALGLAAQITRSRIYLPLVVHPAASPAPTTAAPEATLPPGYLRVALAVLVWRRHVWIER